VQQDHFGGVRFHNIARFRDGEVVVLAKNDLGFVDAARILDGREGKAEPSRRPDQAAGCGRKASHRVNAP
jgi:hypothetical protein